MIIACNTDLSQPVLKKEDWGLGGGRRKRTFRLFKILKMQKEDILAFKMYFV